MSCGSAGEHTPPGKFVYDKTWGIKLVFLSLEIIWFRQGTIRHHESWQTKKVTFEFYDLITWLEVDKYWVNSNISLMKRFKSDLNINNKKCYELQFSVNVK